MDLKDLLPEIHSFSVTNLRYMQHFYEMYVEITNPPQPGENLDREVLFMIPWGHHKLILDKCKDDRGKAIFFLKKTLENNWSRAVLLNFLDTDLYDRQGKADKNRL